MKRRTIIIIAIALFLLALYLFWQQVSSDTAIVAMPETNTAPTAQTAPSRIGTGVATLGELARASENLECSVTYRALESQSESAVEGSYFIANGAVRGDFLQEDTSLGQVVTSYIARGEDMYLWSVIDGISYGVKATATDVTPLAVKVPIPAEEAVRYTCKEWLLVDGSIFEPPASVLFNNAADANIEIGTVYEEGEF